MSELKLFKVKAKVNSVNGRQELHGDEHRLACDVGIEVNQSNRFLDKLDTTLLETFYWKNPVSDEVRQETVEGVERVTDFPNLRALMENIGLPIKWMAKFDDGEFRVHHGDDPADDIILREVKVNEIKLTPKEGGTVLVGLRIQGHPDEGDLARLFTVLQSEVTITINTDPDDEEERQPDLLEKPAKVTKLRKRKANEPVSDEQVDQIAGALSASE
ncbi:hypothetical protein [Paraburkholderia sp.]|uniref:hypothetical protein n=1 Tax=Paraburkholderia sp. TaxID=1926495 RepID=UPI003C7B6D1C